MQGSIEDLIQQLGSNDAMVQQKAAKGLTDFAYESNDNNNNDVKIADAGAIPPLVALLGPRSSSDLHEQVAWALRYLSANNDNKVKIRSAGGVDALTRLMQSTNNDTVKWRAKDALGRIK